MNSLSIVASLLQTDVLETVDKHGRDSQEHEVRSEDHRDGYRGPCTIGIKYIENCCSWSNQGSLFFIDVVGVG